ncbi:MotR protein [Glycocaulis alkaliphilus]|uniref:MotR protein n=1 Tax=Glycocaulis alkaliphilus TaxID=1434191 RepID=A0A3T0EC99_9PROT|nr:AAA family ATPase [Glycocaulis alkaliphilus]AZU04920.1 MotR protein [Glycocaulis alkaliphilus]GGB66662.1 site-determining protein [Glycocaulis alkaliphilus]
MKQYFSTTADDQPRKAGSLLAIASGKGGVGKTVVAGALASAFAARQERTLLVDGDLGMANIDVQLGLDPRGDLSGVMSGQISLAEAVSCVAGGADMTGGFDVIAGRSGSAALAGLDTAGAARLAAGIAAASMTYDRTLIDLAAGADRATIRLAAAADDVVLVMSDEPTSLTDAYAFVKLLRLRDEGAAPFIIVNNAPDKASAEMAYASFARTCESFLGFRPPLAGIIRRDSNVPKAIRAQTALKTLAPGTPAMRDIEAIAGLLAAGAESAYA